MRPEAVGGRLGRTGARRRRDAAHGVGDGVGDARVEGARHDAVRGPGRAPAPARAWAAASFIAGRAARRPVSSRPRNTPGNASTLLIWFGKSLRPVATTATLGGHVGGHHLGHRVGHGEHDGVVGHVGQHPRLDDAGPGQPEQRGRRPSTRRGRRRCGRRGCRGRRTTAWSPCSPVRPRCRTPSRSTPTMSPTPTSASSRAHATPAAPVPTTVTVMSASARPTTRAALSAAASTTIAVPCWSSWNTGMSTASCSRRSISKHAGAAMSSRLMPPNVGAMRRADGHQLVDRAGVDADRVGVDAGEPLEQHGLALHDRAAPPPARCRRARAPRSRWSARRRRCRGRCSPRRASGSSAIAWDTRPTPGV